MSRKISEPARKRLQFVQEFAHPDPRGLVLEKLFDDNDTEWLNTHGSWRAMSDVKTTKNIEWIGRNLWRFFGRNITIQHIPLLGVVADITEKEFEELKTSKLKNYKI